MRHERTSEGLRHPRDWMTANVCEDHEPFACSHQMAVHGRIEPVESIIISLKQATIDQAAL
jgi:hypothetical protein